MALLVPLPSIHKSKYHLTPLISLYSICLYSKTALFLIYMIVLIYSKYDMYSQDYAVFHATHNAYGTLSMPL